MRFRAEQHLNRPGDIRAVREKGQRLECRAFTLWWKRREAAPDAATAVRRPAALRSAPTGPRVCVIASTAAVGNAVRRNHAKRRLREIFRHQQAVVPVDCDLLLIARRSVAEFPMPELEARFAEACRRIPVAADPTP